MTDLIKRLEEAEEGCPFLDREIWVALEFDGNRSPVDAPEYTTSIDAALALAERVLPGWHYELTPGRAGIAAEQWSYYDSAEDEGGQSARAKTTPLALCIAILKATDTGRE